MVSGLCSALGPSSTIDPIFVRSLLSHMLTSGEGGWGVGRGGILLLIIVHMQIVLCG